MESRPTNAKEVIESAFEKYSEIFMKEQDRLVDETRVWLCCVELICRANPKYEMNPKYI